MDQPKNQLVQKINDCSNILVTVSRDPSVDQLAAAIGLTIALNAAGKHATAVYSGKTPSAIEFLQPEETIKKDTNSLRDFIISLDKEKADKLRYKVEDTMVKIFITPYRTAITNEDLEFSEGDFNVDMVIALGVREKAELDEAITSHGRILHDAAVATLNTTTSGQMGSINWVDADASSLSEMLVDVVEKIKEDVMDKQMATAFLTGIVAETDRFSNDKTSSNTMNASALLMGAGADQQLVATKLQQPAVEVEPQPQPDNEEEPQHKDDNGVLRVERSQSSEDANESSESEEQDKSEPPIFDEILPEPSQPEENQPADTNNDRENEESTEGDNTSRGDYLDSADAPDKPLTANYVDSDETPNPTQTNPNDHVFAKRDRTTVQPSNSDEQSQPEENQPAQVESEQNDDEDYNKTMSAPVPDSQSLSDLEAAVESPHVAAGAVWPTQNKPQDNETSEVIEPSKDSARAAIDEAMKHAKDVSNTQAPSNTEGGMNIEHAEDSDDHNLHIDPATGQMQYVKDVEITHDQPTPQSNAAPQEPTAPQNPIAPPPVPPPMMPPMPQNPNNPDQASNGQPLPPVNY